MSGWQLAERVASRANFLDLDFDLLTIDQTLALLAERPATAPFEFIVTPNVDHMVRLRDPAKADAALRDAYQAAALRLCDSRIVARLARLYGVALTLVPGSDLTARLFDEVIEEGDRIAIVGAGEQAIRRLRERWPAVEFLHHVPPMGLRHNAAAIAKAAAFVRDSRARFAFLAVGSPQQEMIAAEVVREAEGTGIGLCVGASIDFLTGVDRRAPRIIQRLGFEWAHRLASNPARMWRRYLVEGPRIFRLAAAWRRNGGGARR